MARITLRVKRAGAYNSSTGTEFTIVQPVIGTGAKVATLGTPSRRYSTTPDLPAPDSATRVSIPLILEIFSFRIFSLTGWVM